MWTAALSLIAATAGTAPVEGGGSTEIIQLVTSALNLGVLGVVFWLFVNGKLHSSEEMDREVAAREKAEEQLAEALKFARDQMAPLLSDFTNATSALLPILQGLVTRLEITGREGDSRDRNSRRHER